MVEFRCDHQGIITTGDHTINTQIHIPVEALRPVSEVAAPPGTLNVAGRTWYSSAGPMIWPLWTRRSRTESRPV
ncbi:hypothetical protein [Acrocarpospora macrocephala]|uniref:hypothetical protein n=1 Tax=Acrocarpospora macrocephala TaxID=150177 RepID=UPI0012D2B84A|nr:hypothetical protein [Acrocarpospora macrocephala]